MTEKKKEQFKITPENFKAFYKQQIFYYFLSAAVPDSMTHEEAEEVEEMLQKIRAVVRKHPLLNAYIKEDFSMVLATEQPVLSVNAWKQRVQSILDSEIRDLILFERKLREDLYGKTYY